MEFYLLKPYEGNGRLKLINRDTDILIGRQVKEGELPDFIVKPLPLISDRVKLLLEQYLPSMEFTPFLLEGKDTPEMWGFHPKPLDGKQARYDVDGTVEALCYRGLLPVFTIPNYKKISYVVSLALAESLLRRGFVNLGLKRLNTFEVQGEA